MQFTDTVTIDGTHIRSDGYLVADALVARTGIQRYLGIEVGRPDLPYVDVYRPESEVFSTDAMASFAHIPITDDHPVEAVTAENWKRLAVGQTSDEIARDGDKLRVPLMVADAAVIKKVQGGKRELSAGYTCELVWGDGITEDGSAYQARQTNIRANHVAIVQRGRAGTDVRIGDKEKTMTLRTVTVDGLSVETTDAGAQAIDKLQATITQKDADLSALQARLDDALGKVLDQDALDKLVANRVALEATAASIAKDVKPAGMSDAELKLAVVKASLGDRLPADRLADQAYIDARFDILAEDAAKSNDTFRATKRGGLPVSDARALRQMAFDDLLYYDTHGVDRAN